MSKKQTRRNNYLKAKNIKNNNISPALVRGSRLTQKKANHVVKVLGDN